MEIIDMQCTACAHSARGGVDEQQVRPRIGKNPGWQGRAVCGSWQVGGRVLPQSLQNEFLPKAKKPLTFSKK